VTLEPGGGVGTSSTFASPVDEVTLWAPYCGPGVTPADVFTRWNFDPGVLAVLSMMAIFVALRRAGRERVAGLAGIGILVLAFVSPLCALSSALFAARTVHHVLLVVAAAPLVAFSLPRCRVGSLALATALQAVMFWVWHAPAAYEAALSSDFVYWIMQAAILGSAVWFWAAVRRASAPAAVAALLAAMIAMGLLGALLTFVSAPLYAPHSLTTQVWGLTPLEDQQTAGLIMWAPAAAAYLAARS
jgi:putative membrane protein